MASCYPSLLHKYIFHTTARNKRNKLDFPEAPFYFFAHAIIVTVPEFYRKLQGRKPSQVCQLVLDQLLLIRCLTSSAHIQHFELVDPSDFDCIHKK